jgi:glycosyltransferase involved in cell wall biosynthesis
MSPRRRDAALIVNGRFLGTPPGSASGVQRVARGLLDAARVAGLPLEVVAPASTDDPRVDRRLWSPPGRIGDRVWEQVALPLFVRGRPILSLANTAPLAARRSIAMIHDLAPVIAPQWFTRSGRRHGKLLLASARRAHTVLTVSEVVRDELAGRGLRRERIFVVRPAVDERFRPASTSEVDRVRARFGLQRPYLLHIGWADPRKNAATAVAAHLRAVERMPHDLILTGVPRPMFEPVRISPVESIRTLPPIPDEDLVPLLSGAAAFLYPSLYEGFGLPPLEALSCGTPALVSDIPVLHESAQDRATYLPPGDVEAWVGAIHAALRGELRPSPPPAWTWADAARALRSALESAGFL